MLKNQRHELFLREYFANGWKGKQAYITVYGHCKTADTQASKLLAKPKVRKRFNQMVSRLIKRADITEEKVLSQYQEAYDLALSQGKTADMVSATTAQAKLVGLLRERLETGAPGDFDRLDTVSDVLEALAQRVGPEVALKISAALGIQPQIEAQPAEDLTELAEASPGSNAVN